MTGFGFELVTIKNPDSLNLILGQTHFIKTVEDICELIACINAGAKYGIAFNEASGPCLIRSAGTSKELEELAIENAQLLKSGHVFILFLENIYPINILSQLKQLGVVCNIICATANPLQVVLATSEQGSGIMGVIDGESPKGVEGEEDKKKRHGFLRMIGYKF
jgi:uncharacterized protein